MTQTKTQTTSPKRLARIAGVLYLLVIGVKTQKPDERILVNDPKSGTGPILVKAHQ